MPPPRLNLPVNVGIPCCNTFTSPRAADKNAEGTVSKELVRHCTYQTAAACLFDCIRRENWFVSRNAHPSYNKTSRFPTAGSRWVISSPQHKS
jgi:hypothetical protein